MTIYFDNNATTPILPEVVTAMMEDLDGIPRNPSSVTTFGRQGRQKLILARKRIADYFGVLPEEVYFTSGGTESNQLMIQGFHKLSPGEIITSRIEHKSIIEPISHLGRKATYIDIDSWGAPTKSQIEETITSHTSMIVLSAVNSETGVKLHLDEIAALAEFYQIPLLIDGVALLGKEKISSLPQGVSAISFSGHKCHGPKGVGLLIVRKKHKIPPLFRGGFQERGLRPGTENLPGILGLAKAIELIDPSSIEELRNYFEEKIGGVVNGDGPRISNTSNLYFPGIDAESLLIQLDQNGVITSLGSACSAGTLEPSHVLLNMGYTKERALSSLRFSFSRLNNKEEIDQACQIISSFIPSNL